MAKKEKEEKKEKSLDSAALSKLIIKDLNASAEGTGKVAWSLGNDDDDPTTVREFISTGSTLLNYTISNRRDGGIPVGKITEITGEEASGKSLIIAHLIAETQRRGGIAAYLDVENSANPEFMERLGVNIKEMIYLQPRTLEEAGEMIKKIIIMTRLKAPDKLVLIALDSIAATPTKIEIEGDFDLNMNLQLEKSKVLSKMMRMLTETLGTERIALVFTNQLKVKIGVMYGDPMTTPGGKAVPYHASVRIRLEAGVKQKDKADQVYGIHTRAKIVKNRMGPPWRKTEFDILFSSGIDDENSWIQKLHECDEIMKKEGWCYLTSFPSGKVQEKGVNEGKDLGIAFRESEFKQLLVDRPEVKEHVLKLIEKHMVVKYGERPKDLDLNPESLMDAESVQETLMTGE